MIVKMRELIRWILMQPRFWVLTKIYKMNISPTARVALGAKLDKTNPKGIYIDDESYIATGAVVLSHGGGTYKKTFIGKKCLVGVNAIILQGIKISDHVVVGAGSVVTKDIPSNCAVAGNPAKIIKIDIVTKKYGRFVSKGVSV